jgi:anti-anti-sigma regulatory factor
MMDVTRGARGELIIRIAGTFDGTAASRLNGWLGEISSGDQLVVDFSQVRDCHDFGLAAVARDFAGRGPHVQVRGLTRHQQRMLRYFGLDLRDLQEEAVG